ncbi:exodeoxyribonuclease V subunit alpha [Eikenella longinqua]|uniref:RecBCD enzyme subunit RecD n=1 Tax=Eikenella longinqua TaxID=1795827 RepID=A0A1A9RUR8_9NEIS|nr:exodeoxyribonuclease V subunit alpha [Eikenella longinqua]OAM26780.1 exodeoxyribonuclease V subunit alpha [Eikenella longinqua]
MSSETPFLAAQAAAEVLQRLAPQAAAPVLPLLAELFAAQEGGHSYITLTPQQAAELRQAAPIVGDGEGFTPLVLRGRKLFSGRLFALEQDVAAELKRIARGQVGLPENAWLRQRLQDWFPDAGYDGQRLAAALAVLQPLMLVNGGPGTGKTTTVARLLALLCHDAEHLPRIALTAPTGKAAAHLTRSLHRALRSFETGNEAVAQHLAALEGQTVHRLLRLGGSNGRPQFNREQPLPFDIIVADEASMLDLPLLHQLLCAVPEHGRLILLGDENQLPPVGIGAVLPVLAQPTVLTAAQASQLADWLGGSVPFAANDSPPPLAGNVVRLERSHRFDPQRGVGALAQAVVAGNAEGPVAAFERFPAELLRLPENPADLARAFAKRHADYWQAVAGGDAAACFAEQQRLVVLAARREQAAQFNREYLRLLAAEGRAAAQGWFAGQVLMVAENDYAVKVFNGDIGIVLPQGDGLAAFFPDAGGFRAVALSCLPAHDTAFAMTVHKSQGSEYEEVWLLGDAGESALFDRTLLYTAVTRARERFGYAGGTAALEEAVRRKNSRHTGLGEALARAGE